MDILGDMVSKAEGEGLLQPLSTRSLPHRISLYADDVAIFLHPRESDIQMILSILHLFGEASGLKNNVQKSNVYPIRCDDQDIAILNERLPCEVSAFPCTYLGLPLSLKKLSKSQVQPIIDKIAYQLPG
jgi:hypothetical protein